MGACLTKDNLYLSRTCLDYLPAMYQITFSFFFAGECEWWGKENLLGVLITVLGKTRYIYTVLGKARDVENRLC